MGKGAFKDRKMSVIEIKGRADARKKKMVQKYAKLIRRLVLLLSMAVLLMVLGTFWAAVSIPMSLKDPDRKYSANHQEVAGEDYNFGHDFGGYLWLLANALVQYYAK
eukprot:CAMPEP_0114508456 /NCGR_PEP_ID=MMETSP0109-20121206/12613_1 /TAXON_ID=29199 /ORGANISM="Chlorarachnion reptans, Strain CCCM449" /LENGTH=106 /DNA_ID=CAMNT_0001687397 /DNA_START=942 /DNA_END=1262 /DNA_ORIENTATION=+